MKKLIISLVCALLAGAAFAQTKTPEQNLAEKWGKYEAALETNTDVSYAETTAFFNRNLKELKDNILLIWKEFNDIKSATTSWVAFFTKENCENIKEACNSLLQEVSIVQLESDTDFPADNKNKSFRWLTITNAGMKVIVAEMEYLKAGGKDNAVLAKRINKQIQRLRTGPGLKLSRPNYIPASVKTAENTKTQEELLRGLNLALTEGNNNNSLNNVVSGFNAI